MKKSLAIAGHKTSLALEPEFWTELEAAAAERGLALPRLIAEIDQDRNARGTRRSLASSIRVWLLTRAIDQRDGGSGSTRAGSAAVNKSRETA